jgi:hypothetical protein
MKEYGSSAIKFLILLYGALKGTGATAQSVLRLRSATSVPWLVARNAAATVWPLA